jgi:hypothetical protein
MARQKTTLAGDRHDAIRFLRREGLLTDWRRENAHRSKAVPAEPQSGVSKVDVGEQWKAWFKDWPEELPHKGVIVTIMGEQIPFHGFLAGEEMVLVQRQTPDSLGARQVLLPYQRIDSLKITDIVSPKVFTAAGFIGKLPKR